MEVITTDGNSTFYDMGAFTHDEDAFTPLSELLDLFRVVDIYVASRGPVYIYFYRSFRNFFTIVSGIFFLPEFREFFVP